MGRFALQWLTSDEPDRLTHVTLLDGERPAPHVLAIGHGADKINALLNLWRTLIEIQALPQAIDYVAVAYTRRTGKAPGKSSH